MPDLEGKTHRLADLADNQVIARVAGALAASYIAALIATGDLTIDQVDGLQDELDTLTAAVSALTLLGTFNAFTKDLGAARRSGTFDITGLSGLTADKHVTVIQTAAPIASKGNARDEFEMDRIELTGYVVDANTIRVFWQAPSVVVGTYAFAYLVSQ